MLLSLTLFLIQLEESPDFFRIFKKVVNIRLEKLEEIHKNDQNNISNEG